MLLASPVEPDFGRRARVPHQTDCEWVTFQQRIEHGNAKLLGVLFQACRQALNPQRNATAPLR
jgi:hypothetical protein